ncbi:MAG TPA: SpoIVB peptidase [Oscillospiraceae bacterium]|nr:SpoIVB peptidase [Oscillospiraceae bacterium]
MNKINFNRIKYVICACLAASMATVSIFHIILPDHYTIYENDTFSFSSSYGKLVTASAWDAGTEEVFAGNRSRFQADLRLLGFIDIKTVSVEIREGDEVWVCGTPLGIKLFTEGVLVVGMERLQSTAGAICPASSAGLKTGDVICRVNGTAVATNEDIAKLIQNSGGNALSLSIRRGEETVEISLTPAQMKDGTGYKGGFWVRDSSAGIGTLTFYDEESGSFAGLGHAVCDVDTGDVLPLLSGEIVGASVTGVVRGVSGNPGELKGVFLSLDPLGILKQNCESGIYGTMDAVPEGSFSMVIAPKQEVREGPAEILTTVDGAEAARYNINIERINYSDGNPTKNMVIRVTDEALLQKTGGIVQGMSGSPILQDGRLVGAVTHVFVNDSAKGYAIFAENMAEIAAGIE